MTDSQNSSSSVSSLFSPTFTYSPKWQLYGSPKIVSLEEVKVETEKKDEVNIDIPDQSFVSKKGIQTEITKLTTPLYDTILSRIGDQPTRSKTRTVIIEEMYRMLEYMELDSTIGGSCYFNRLPDDVMLVILSFNTPRELRCIQSVCNRLTHISYPIITQSLQFFCKGRVAYFAYGSYWTLGVILCIINIVDPDTYEIHNGYHVCIMDGDDIYITQDEIVQYSFIGLIKDMPQSVPLPINRYDNYTPYGANPHSLCTHGYYTKDHTSTTTAPSSCIVLRDGYKPPITHNLVGQVVSIDSFPRHMLHLQVSIERERVYGVSFENSRNVNNNIDDDYNTIDDYYNEVDYADGYDGDRYYNYVYNGDGYNGVGHYNGGY
jgi:hypothetical protein